MKYRLFFLLLFFWGNGSANTTTDEGLFFSIGIGRAHNQINNPFSSEDTEKKTQLGFSGSIGYVFKNQVFVEGEYASYHNLDLFNNLDSIEMDRLNLFLGYQIHLSHYFILTPKLGYIDWNLKFEEGSVNASENKRKIRLKGDNFQWSIALQLRLHESLKFVLAHTEADLRVGEQSNTSLSLVFH